MVPGMSGLCFRTLPGALEREGLSSCRAPGQGFRVHGIPEDPMFQDVEFSVDEGRFEPIRIVNML